MALFDPILIGENRLLQSQLEKKDNIIASLRRDVQRLEREIQYDVTWADRALKAEDQLRKFRTVALFFDSFLKENKI